MNKGLMCVTQVEKCVFRYGEVIYRPLLKKKKKKREARGWGLLRHSALRAADRLEYSTQTEDWPLFCWTAVSLLAKKNQPYFFLTIALC